MKNFENSEWIWYTEHAAPDEYGEFYTSFEHSDEKTELFISADSNYAVYLNGKLCASLQYADYPYDKVYDRIDLSEHTAVGKNHLAIVVWYYGISTTQVYYPGKAGLRFELKSDGRTVAHSGVDTLSRQSRAYVSHEKKEITRQLGLSFHYDASLEDNWMFGELNGFSRSVIADVDAPLRERPIKRLNCDSFRSGNLIKTLEDGKLLYDLGINSVGFLEIEVEAEKKTHLTIAYGEHIVDGSVRRLIGSRDFSVQITVPAGTAAYVNPFRRLGAKYLEIESDAPIKIKKIGIRETLYPINKLPRPALNEKENSIYDICERSLILCMHEHYEDCPWREQSLYCLDSRNQMLCGYYAFGEFEFPRANLELIAADRRADGLLSICAPMSGDLAIPSFSLHFFSECAEYLEHSGDKEFLRKIYPKLIDILGVFLKRGADSGKLIKIFEGDAYWNFYEWSEGLHGYGKSAPPVCDLPLNALLSIALSKMAYIASELGYEDSFTDTAKKLNEAIRNEFYDKERGLFKDIGNSERFSTLGNSLAILAGVPDVSEQAEIAEKLITDDSLTQISLSMICFRNDALLKVDKEKYSPKILEDIERIYLPMADMGIGTVWEGYSGESEFDSAGSLCHGWSALPIYYYHILKKQQKHPNS